MSELGADLQLALRGRGRGRGECGNKVGAGHGELAVVWERLRAEGRSAPQHFTTGSLQGRPMLLPNADMIYRYIPELAKIMDVNT